MAERPKVVKLEMTCMASPSQWEGKLNTGQRVYIRFRWGILSCHVYDDGIRYWYDDKYVVFRKQISHDLDGVLSEENMISQLSDVLDFSNLEIA